MQHLAFFFLPPNPLSSQLNNEIMFLLIAYKMSEFIILYHISVHQHFFKLLFVPEKEAKLYLLCDSIVPYVFWMEAPGMKAHT